MTTTLFSSAWYRVAPLKPRLRGQARVTRHEYRGQRWYVLQDMASGKFLRLDAQAWRIVALMDGLRTLDEIWQNTCVTLGDDAPTQDEVLQLLTQLHQANVLLSGRPPDMDELERRRRKAFWARLKQYIANPLALKFPLVDPDRFLGWIVSLLPRGAGPWLLVAWLGLMIFGGINAALHWDELTHELASSIFTPQNMLLMALAFPVLKAIHEIGHGIAIKLFGGSCHEMGLMFLVFIPVPYVDATQATALQSKWQRMVVGLAGMMIELAAASVALWLWTQASPGVGKAFWHQVVILASLTTIIFNANPLLRFDGYYVLADWLEIPNLGQKANQYLGRLINQYGFGVRDALPHLRLAPGEKPWLLAYSVLSFIYRMVIAVTIVLFVARQFFFVGVLLAIWSAWGTVGAPVWRHLKYLSTHQALVGRRLRAWAVSSSVVLGCAAVVMYVPVRSWTNAEGVVWMPEASRVRANNACFAVELLARPGALVKSGQPLLSCADAELDTQYAQTEARRGELAARLSVAQATDRVQAQIAADELAVIDRRLADVRQRRADLAVRASQDGRFVMPNPGDFQGKFFNRGDLVAYVLDPTRFTLLTVVGQGDVDLVRQATQGVQLRTADQLARVVSARIEREVPGATAQLPSLALSLQGGGKIGLDPKSSETDPKALSALFQFELQLIDAQTPATVGQRVHVQFVHPDEPLADQWYRTVRQLFLRTFQA